MTNTVVHTEDNGSPSRQGLPSRLDISPTPISTPLPAKSSTRNTSSTMARSEFPQKLWAIVTWTPKRCRYDPNLPPRFNLSLNLLFSFACTFTVANLYYNHPILNILAQDFHVTNERASIIPTLMQAGYVSGLLFICPLGDLFPRRPFVLLLIFCTSTLWLGLCLTNSFAVFSALSFITAVTTVTPQLMLPLVGDLAPPHKRAFSLSIVTSGLLLGILIARLISGILTQYTSWRAVYWFGFGVQYLILILLFFFMPDYPSTNPGNFNYFHVLLSIAQLVIKHPPLVQCCLVGFLASSTFTSYWTTLTFLLSSPPYNYSSVTIGLFALIGILALLLGPFYSKAVIDHFVPLFSITLGLLYCLIGIIIGTYSGEHTVTGPVIMAFAIDIGLQSSQTANRATIYPLAPKATNRINTAYMVSVFCGQLMGTAAGNKLYAEGGWIKSGSASVGFICAALLICALRGPWATGWLGWQGGWGIRRRDLQTKGKTADVEANSAQVSAPDTVDDVSNIDHTEGREKTQASDSNANAQTLEMNEKVENHSSADN